MSSPIRSSNLRIRAPHYLTVLPYENQTIKGKRRPQEPKPTTWLPLTSHDADKLIRCSFSKPACRCYILESDAPCPKQFRDSTFRIQKSKSKARRRRGNAERSAEPWLEFVLLDLWFYIRFYLDFWVDRAPQGIVLSRFALDEMQCSLSTSAI